MPLMRLIASTLMQLIALSLCTSCNRTPIGQYDSLVGAETLPPADLLSRETIEIDQERYEPGPRLIYQLEPNNSLTITLTDWTPEQRILAKQSFQLSTDAANNARRLLWRIRPERLQGMAETTKLQDCPPPPPDEFPDLTVGFIVNGPKTADDVGNVGIFAVSPGCQTRDATEVRQVIRQALSLFPPSTIPAEFDRRIRSLRDERALS